MPEKKKILRCARRTLAPEELSRTPF